MQLIFRNFGAAWVSDVGPQNMVPSTACNSRRYNVVAWLEICAKIKINKDGRGSGGGGSRASAQLTNETAAVAGKTFMNDDGNI